MSPKRILSLSLLLALGCPERSSRESAAPRDAASAQATRAPTAEPQPRSEPEPEQVRPSSHHGLPWYADAPEAAFSAARAEGKLVFVDLWAAWCHTCLSMREYVLTADNLAPVKDRLVFLALDTERKENAQSLQALPIAAWPTFYLVDAAHNLHGRWVGAASTTQLVGFVRDGLRAYDAARSEQLAADDPLALLIAGDRLAAAEKLAEARQSYELALAHAAPDWARRPDGLLALASTLRKLDEDAACVDLGLRDLAHTGRTATATDFSYQVLACADALPPGDGRGRRLRKLGERHLDSLCTKGSEHMTPDDRGDACGLLYELRQKLGQQASAKRAAAQRLSILRAAANGLPDAVALTYDFARVEALQQLGRSAEAVALLSAREQALPDDYNPPHYLARLYRDLARFDEGLAAVERALARVEGPRRGAILGVKVDLLAGLGRSDEAKRTLEEQLATYRSLPEGQAQPGREASVAARLATWK